MQVDLRILRFDPERGRRAALGVLPRRGGPDGPRPQPPDRREGRAGRHAHLPALLRPRGVRLGRHADQRTHRLAARSGWTKLGRKIAVAPLTGLARREGPGRRHGRVLREVPQRDAVPHRGHAGTRARAAPEARRIGRATTTRRKCILCAACTTAWPVLLAAPARVRRPRRDRDTPHRFIFDTRDDAGDERLEILADKDGVWRCRTIFNCVDACPRGINITRGDPRGVAGGGGAVGLSGPTGRRRPPPESSGRTARRAATRAPLRRCRPDRRRRAGAERPKRGRWPRSPRALGHQDQQRCRVDGRRARPRPRR